MNKFYHILRIVTTNKTCIITDTKKYIWNSGVNGYMFSLFTILIKYDTKCRNHTNAERSKKNNATYSFKGITIIRLINDIEVIIIPLHGKFLGSHCNISNEYKDEIYVE